MANMLTAPDGTVIVGVLETIPNCTARVNPNQPINDDGTPNYVGGTVVNWDAQTPMMRDGELVYIDENGRAWKRSELVDTASDGDGS